MSYIRFAQFVQRGAVLGVAMLVSSACALAQDAAPSADKTEPATYSSSQIANLSLPDLPISHAALGASSRNARPPYRGASNRDNGPWSKLAFEVGGGFNAPAPDSADYISWGGHFNLGAGYRFSPYVTMLAEYEFIDDKLPGHIIAQTGADGGNAHIWSLTAKPIITLNPKSTYNVYLTGGGGFYRKVTNFTDPVLAYYCDYYYCSVGTTNQVIGHFSSNQGGWSGGMGIQRHVGDSRMKLFLEARYLEIETPAVTTQPNGLGTVTVGSGTSLLPVTFGVRW